MNTVLVDAFLNLYNMGPKVNGTSFLRLSTIYIMEKLVKTFNVQVEKGSSEESTEDHKETLLCFL